MGRTKIKRNIPARRKCPKNKTIEEKTLIKKIHQWTTEAINRETLGEKVFDTRYKAEMTAQICDVSKATVFRALQDPLPRETMGRPTIHFDDYDKKGLSRLILGFYTRTPPQLPTLDLIWSEAMKLPDFPPCGQTTLRKLIKSVGFVCKKRNTKMHVYQRMDVVAQRHKVLRALTHFRANGYEIFYQDETWCNANHTRQYIWQLEDKSSKNNDNSNINAKCINKENLLEGTEWKGGLKVPCGSGRRVIVNHIGSNDGFLPGCGECFIGKKDSGDYHSEMNSKHFEEWWSTKVLPALPEKSVTVIDNASYHTRQTDDSKKKKTSWRKEEIRTWLKQHGVVYDEKDTVPILLNLSRDFFLPKQYVLESITTEYCTRSKKDINILRLPVGHSELNPIELIWAQAKDEVARKNVKFNITTVKELMQSALNNVTPRNWAAAITHTIKVEDAFRKIDFGDDVPQVEPVIIQVSNQETDSESEFSDEDESDDE